jgi:hypothetical protein
MSASQPASSASSEAGHAGLGHGGLQRGGLVVAHGHQFGTAVVLLQRLDVVGRDAAATDQRKTDGPVQDRQGDRCGKGRCGIHAAANSTGAPKIQAETTS